MNTTTIYGRCKALVLRNGYFTGRRCSRAAVTEVNGKCLCSQHARMAADGTLIHTG